MILPVVRWFCVGVVLVAGSRLGVVNLLGLLCGIGMVGPVGSMARLASGGRGRASDLVPGGESGAHLAPVLAGTKPVTTGPEMWGDPAEGGQEPLGVSG